MAFEKTKESNKIIREIVTCNLVYIDDSPAILLEDKKKAELVIDESKKKGKSAFLKPLTLPKHRFDEIGKNIFQITKQMKPEHIDRILEVREKLIRKSMDVRDDKSICIELAWKTVSKEAGSPYDKLEWSEFNQLTHDIAQFILWKR